MLHYSDFFSSLASDAISEQREEYADTMIEVKSFVETLDPDLPQQQLLGSLKRELNRRLRQDHESDEILSALQEALVFIEDELESLNIDA